MMDKETQSIIDLATSAIRKKEMGEHFSDMECIAAVQVLEAARRFASNLDLRITGLWMANTYEFFSSVASNRGLFDEQKGENHAESET